MLNTALDSVAVGSSPISAHRKSTVAIENGRFDQVSLAGVGVRKALSADDWVLVEAIRTSAFSRLERRGARRSLRSWLDATDTRPGTFSLIGFARNHEPIATLRVQDGRAGPLELSEHLPLDVLLKPQERPAAQFARLAALRHAESLDVMFGLFKAAWRWCLGQQMRSIVIATPPWTRPIYDHLCFSECVRDFSFLHPMSTRAPHAVMTLSVGGAEATWRRLHRPLVSQFFETDHPALRFWP